MSETIERLEADLRAEASGFHATQKKLLTAEQVADWLQTPLSSVYDMTHRRRIPFIKLGSRLRFRAEEIDEWLRRQNVEDDSTHD